MADSNPNFNFFMFKNNGYTIQVIIKFNNNKLELKLKFFDINYNLIGNSSLNFNIINRKIKWEQPVWISQDCMDYCDKLLNLRAFA
jgi:hypothetical protein